MGNATFLLSNSLAKRSKMHAWRIQHPTQASETSDDWHTVAGRITAHSCTDQRVSVQNARLKLLPAEPHNSFSRKRVRQQQQQQQQQQDSQQLFSSLLRV